ncbi:MAG: hypothetical protein H0X33_14855 [Taibaiella sp.]|nr:hypothetical protein [Taibaiella sp.]
MEDFNKQEDVNKTETNKPFTSAPAQTAPAGKAIKDHGPTGDGNPPVDTKVGAIPKYVEPKKEVPKTNPLNDLNYLEDRLKAIDGKDVHQDDKKTPEADKK